MLMPKLTKTDRILQAMLTENTGRHICDSGGAYGRHWERNQGKQFIDEPYQRTRFSVRNDQLEVEYVRSVFHFLRESVTYESVLQRKFNAFCRRKDWKDDHWLACMEGFVKDLAERGLVEDWGTINTYNNEDALSQTLQYTHFDLQEPLGDLSEGRYALLQIHGGCDVRGGYTAPKAFSYNEEWSLFDNARGSLCCASDYDHRWFTDDAGYRWDLEMYPRPSGMPTRLDEVEVRELDEHEPIVTLADFGPDDPLLGDDFAHEHVVGYVQVKDGKGYCPICGGLLE